MADGKVIAELTGVFLIVDVKKEIARVGQVIGHETRGENRIALFNGDQDGLMELQGMLQID